MVLSALNGDDYEDDDDDSDRGTYPTPQVISKTGSTGSIGDNMESAR